MNSIVCGVLVGQLDWLWERAGVVGGQRGITGWEHVEVNVRGRRHGDGSGEGAESDVNREDAK